MAHIDFFKNFIYYIFHNLLLDVSVITGVVVFPDSTEMTVTWDHFVSRTLTFAGTVPLAGNNSIFYNFYMLNVSFC